MTLSLRYKKPERQLLPLPKYNYSSIKLLN